MPASPDRARDRGVRLVQLSLYAAKSRPRPKAVTAKALLGILSSVRIGSDQVSP